MLIDRRIFLSLVAVATAAPAFAIGGAPRGQIETLPKFAADNLTEPRIRVWLPPGYSETERSCRTIYMLDGQYAFADDSDGANFAADRRIARLMEVGSIEPTLIVAIDNLDEDRFLQYMPQTIYDRANGDVRAIIEREINRVGKTSLVSGQFIQFLTNQLKPFVDAHYRTSADRLDTAIFGASMAGVMAGAIFVEAQQTFGRAACMSPNWPIYDERMIDYPKLPSLWSTYFAQLGNPAGRRLWLDHGTEMMDAGMAPHQSAIAASLADLEWRRGCNLQTRVYDAGHAFAQTATQMDEVLAWLLA
ncbi:MAG: alpha/beta hydrolase-fold protein [Parasphingorhabdus sp.]|uniref:alpha/beta hydrolase n=1 Tax=Parasphingorhabdus sp. TaxID=2709688 RepID=UPI003002E623